MPTLKGQTLWHVPYQRNPYFTGREDVLSDLHRALHAENRVALSHPQGISGLGGIGKTQTALEYAYRYRTEYDAIFWVRADSFTSLTSSLVELAHVLELPERNAQDQEVIVQSVLRWLRLHPDWLLIYDNIDDLSIIEPFLPNAGTGHLLFTTRAHALSGLAQRLDLQKMQPDTGALLLLRRASLLALKDSLDVVNPDHQSVARTISQELDGLPLALDQAGAYIKEAPCPLPDYLPLYRVRRSDILGVRGRFDQDYPAAVATTWSLSFEKVRQTNPASAELLNFCAFLAPDAIPEEMIVGGAQYLTSSLRTAVTHPFLFDQMIAVLLAYSLTSRNANKMLSVHRLVQVVLQDEMKEELQHLWAESAVLAVNSVFPVTEYRTWLQCERLLSHALLAERWNETYRINQVEVARLFQKTAGYLHDRARYQEAEPLYKHTLRIREQQFGPDHSEVAYPLNNLGILYKELGKYGEAEPFYQRALHIWEQQLGPDHLLVGSTLNNLANHHRELGKYGEAEPLYQRALRIREQQLGPDHSEVAALLSNLGILYKEQGKYGEAESLYRRALRIREQQLGTDHPLVAYPLNELALLCKELGKYGEAESLYQRALSIREQQLGTDHPLVAYPLNNLGMLYNELGRYGEAESLYQRALRIWEQQLGTNHSLVAYPLDGLATLYREQGKYGEAESLYRRALSIREQQLGANHSLVAYPLNGLATFYRDQGKYEEAESLYQRALSIREQQLGANHSLVAYPLNGLATLYRDQGKYEEAESLYQRALRILEQALGAQHPDVAEITHGIAQLREVQDKSEEARIWYARTLAIRAQALGVYHPKTTETRKCLIALIRTIGQYEEVAQLEELGPGHE